MKKIFLLIPIFTVFISSIFLIAPQNKSEAATSSWQSIKGVSGCQVRVWTDYTTYTSNATTIDSYLESNGQCGKLDYEGMVAQQNGTENFHSKTMYSGYFSNKTPVKTFNLDQFTGKFDETVKDIYVYALVWADGKKSTTATSVQSLPLTVNKR
ncbi:hypothetical protein NSQ59_10280 [Margalitia sp. FSL K6-0131]|uniref:hypothetical protein n=1 Tax=Margalitia sp. FSL K6-0131 TaxID=2954604 RepID=UPI0030F75577